MPARRPTCDRGSARTYYGARPGRVAVYSLVAVRTPCAVAARPRRSSVALQTRPDTCRVSRRLDAPSPGPGASGELHRLVPQSRGRAARRHERPGAEPPPGVAIDVLAYDEEAPAFARYLMPQPIDFVSLTA